MGSAWGTVISAVSPREKAVIVLVTLPRTKRNQGHKKVGVGRWGLDIVELGMRSKAGRSDHSADVVKVTGRVLSSQPMTLVDKESRHQGTGTVCGELYVITGRDLSPSGQVTGGHESKAARVGCVAQTALLLAQPPVQYPRCPRLTPTCWY